MTTQQAMTPNQNGTVSVKQNSNMNLTMEDDFEFQRTFSDPVKKEEERNRKNSETEDAIQLWDPSEARLRTASE